MKPKPCDSGEKLQIADSEDAGHGESYNIKYTSQSGTTLRISSCCGKCKAPKRYMYEFYYWDAVYLISQELDLCRAERLLEAVSEAVKRAYLISTSARQPLLSPFPHSPEISQDKMWLLDTTTLTLSAFFSTIPHYAILSHTWGSEEVSFQDIQGPHELISNRSGYKKIKDCCDKALEVGFKYVWIDTCCIDKTNSTELSEAINSMFGWYQNAVTCYAYLKDVKARPELELHGLSLEHSSWFKRGWTLQELIAPADVLFFDCDWCEIGSRESLRHIIEKITGIPQSVLMSGAWHVNCVAEIMSWAAGRKTMRLEDRAYSLLGLFGVSMPLIYGEGDHAFFRLQLEILKTTTDHSLFAWIAERGPPGAQRGALALSPDEFKKRGRIIHSVPTLDKSSSYEMTNLGLRITLPCLTLKDTPRELFAYLNCKAVGLDEKMLMGIRLMEVTGEDGQPQGRFFRSRPDILFRPLEPKAKKPTHTLLYIIQPNFRISPRQTISLPPRLCCLDYSNLFNAGYVLEAHTMSKIAPLLQRDESKITFKLMPRNRWLVPRPWIIFFKHSGRTARIWIAFIILEGKLWVVMEGSVDEEDTPEFIVKDDALELANRRWDRGEIVKHTLTNTVCDGETVKLSSKRAIIMGKTGFLMKIVICEETESSYQELTAQRDYIPLRKLLTSEKTKLVADGSLGAIERVIELPYATGHE